MSNVSNNQNMNLFAAMGKAGGALYNAATEFVEDSMTNYAKAGNAFEKEGVAGGVLELADAVSSGRGVADGLDALGVIPDNELVKEGVALFVNTMTGNGIAALDNMLDIGKSISGAGNVKPAGSFDVPPPRGHRISHGRTRPGYSRSIHHHHHHKGSININININVNTLLRPAVLMMYPPLLILEIGAGLLPKPTGGPVKEQPLGGSSIKDILNDKSLSFEDMIAMVMMKIVSDQQKEIKEKISQMKGGGGSESAKGTSATPNSGDKDQEALVGMKKLFGGTESLGGALKKFGDFTKMLTPVISAALVPAIGAALTATGVGTALIPFLPVIVPAVVGLASEGMSAGGEALSKGGAGKKSTAGAQSSTGSAAGKKGGKAEGKDDANSKALQMEELKMLTSAMSRMQQAMSNVLNSMHQTSMNAIRNIK